MFSFSHMLKRFAMVAPITMLLFGSCGTSKNVVDLEGRLKVPDSFHVNHNFIGAKLIDKGIFADTNLANLITVAIQQNPDVFIARQRIEMAAARFRTRKGVLLPTISADATASGQKYGDYTMEGVGNFDTNLSGNIDEDQKISLPFAPNYFIGLRSSWEIDLWGKLRNQKKAAYMGLLASEQGRKLVVTTLVAEVATRYYDLVALDAVKDVINANIALQDSALSITLIQKEAGRTTELGVQQMRAQLLRTKALLSKTEQQIVRTENEINYYLGRFPQPVKRHTDILAISTDTNYRPATPAEILVQRPDILEAELNLKASGADVLAAKAELLPALTLMPFAGYSSFNSKLLFDPASLAYGVIGGLTAPLINRSALRGNIKRAEAERSLALHTYNKTVVEAFREVHTITNDISQLKKAYRFNKEETDVLLEAVNTSNELFKVGYASYLEVITAQKTAIEAEINLIETQKNILQGQVYLYRSIGGGW